MFAAAVPLGSANAASAAPAVIKAVGVENEYADVISQIGGQYVQVTAIETDPNTDPHAFEVNPKVAGQIAAADLMIKNGVGYDAWADKIIAAAPNGKRVELHGNLTHGGQVSMQLSRTDLQFGHAPS